MPLDNRKIKITFISDNKITVFENMEIKLTGSLLVDARSVNMTIEIFNLSNDLRQNILSKSFPTNTSKANPVDVIVEVGRESYGYNKLFEGQVFKATQGERPNINVTLECIAGMTVQTKPIVRDGVKGKTLSQIANLVAQDAGLTLYFDAEDKPIEHYSFNGSAQDQIKHLSELTDANVYRSTNSKTLVVIEKGKAIKGKMTIINMRTGLIRANAIQGGVEVRILYDPNITIGSKIQVDSIMNKSIKGLYTVYKVDYVLTSRQNDFYMQLQAGALI